MPRKNPEDYTQAQFKKTVLESIRNLKIHPMQSYSEVIENLLNSPEEFMEKIKNLFNKKDNLKKEDSENITKKEVLVKIP